MFDALARIYKVLLLQEDLEEEQRALSLVGRFQQTRELAIPVLLISLALNGTSTALLRELGRPEGRGWVGAASLAGAEVLSLALFLLVGSLHLRAGLWFGIFHVATGYAALATTLTLSQNPVLYLWMGFLLGLSTSFCFGWTRAWYQVGLSYLVILLFGTWHVLRLRLYLGHAAGPVFRDGLWFLLPNVAGFASGLYSFQGYVAWGIFATVVFFLAALAPAKAPVLLKWGPVHLDNTLQFPLPFLYKHLLLVYERDPAAALEEVRFILAKRPYQRKVARAALDRFLLRALRQVQRPDDLARLRDTPLLREPWHRLATADLRAFVDAISGAESAPQAISAAALQGLAELTADWGEGDGGSPGEELRKELRVVANRWQRWEMPHGSEPVHAPRERAALPSPAPAALAVEATALPAPPSRERVRQALVDQFNLPEIQEIVFDLGLDWDDLAGNTKTEKVMSLIALMERRREMDLLLDQATRRREDFRNDL